MAARRPNITNAGIELGFVVVALVFGTSGAPLWTIAALTLGMIAYWIWSRRNALDEMRRMRPTHLIGSVLVTVALLVAVLGGAYWIGSALRSISP